jgi:replicative DNA helicase
MEYKEKIYTSAVAYETAIFLGCIARLYFQGSEIPKEERNVIESLFTQVTEKQVKSSEIKKIARLTKGLLLKGLEVNYDNLYKYENFRKLFPDRDSFTTVLMNQIIPTVDDVRNFIDALEHISEEKDALDIVLNLDSIKDKSEKFKELTERLDAEKKKKKEEKRYELVAGIDLVTPYTKVLERRETGEGFYPTGFHDIDVFMTEGFAPGLVSLVAARPSIGKCLGKGTKVLMFDGTLRKVEDVCNGDLLMGPDSKPRKVQNVSVGFGDMYKVKQLQGITYRVNSNHMLSLKRSKTEWRQKYGDVLNISINDFMKRQKNLENRYKGYKAFVDFKETPLELEPYFLGLWLGDGRCDDVRITSIDDEIVQYLKEYANRLGYVLTNYQDSYAITRGSSKLPNHTAIGTPQNKLRELNLLGNKHIPRKYLVMGFIMVLVKVLKEEVMR